MRYFIIVFFTLISFFINAKSQEINLLDNKSFKEQRNQWIVDYLSLKNFFNEELDVNFLACINLKFYSTDHIDKDFVCYKLHTTKENIRQMMLFPEKSESNVILLSSFINNQQYIHVSIKQLFKINDHYRDYFANCNFSIPVNDLNQSFNYQSVFKQNNEIICTANFFSSDNNPTSANTIVEVKPSIFNSYSLY